ncbi:MAG: flagellar hook-associated protein FlgL [Bacillota bacterium]|uniref:Flagellar hook-associated protein FlgL n=1 Tax=Virgibacillus salarius TaxID=447199 RepID=A0A941ICU7_9BACI|nr:MULTISPECIES: flagellar hook-associated protein FlgL [Bacillaceae]MBR7797881.1 flagellar hook-associated protein FlgL [Virgibacillus salarius]MDY7042868.1 flagellar hook-associated protein FlgL [Virgibacillus sp. M23]NAZ10591.1 flagellar hook-associated protein FlgL [Agaribacter marinus]WBX78641.1 flagellar hook-associated protein FlgL [Virgibacillus salarius]
MRITQSMLSNNMLRNLSNSYAKLDQYMDQVSTGKKINRPSDNPVIAMKGINFRSQVNEAEQYMRNTGEVHNWMDNSDAALDKATQTMQKLRELAVQASTGTYDEEERENIKKEAEQLKEHLINIANTQVNGKYIFNGTNTTEPPYDATNGFNANTDPIKIPVAAGTELQANVNGEEVFGNELFDKIDTFIENLGNDNQAGIGASIEDLDTGINQIVNARADLGARMNRLELVENRLSEQEIIAKKTMAENESVDYEEAITNLITQESLHRAALSAGSRIIQPSLIDFLR